MKPVDALFLITEKQFLEQIRSLAKMTGWMVYHTYDSRRSQAGFPDLTMARRPRIIFAEAKREGGEATDPQEEWGDELSDCGGVEYYLWQPSDWDQIVEVLR